MAQEKTEREPRWERHFAKFIRTMSERLTRGHLEYGDESFSKPHDTLTNEMEEEILDIIGWAFIRWVKIQDAEQGACPTCSRTFKKLQ